MDIGELPDGVTLVRTTPTFDESTVPAGLRRAHRVADDVWGRIVVRSGTLTIRFDDAVGDSHVLASGHTAVLAPSRPHHVEIDGPVTFAVEFHRHPDSHSEGPAGDERDAS